MKKEYQILFGVGVALAVIYYVTRKPSSDNKKTVASVAKSATTTATDAIAAVADEVNVKFSQIPKISAVPIIPIARTGQTFLEPPVEETWAI